jgi:hypothetical protein
MSGVCLGGLSVRDRCPYVLSQQWLERVSNHLWLERVCVSSTDGGHHARMLAGEAFAFACLRGTEKV